MVLKVTETFNRTSLAFYSGKYTQIVSMGGSRSSKTFSFLQILMLELMYKKNLKVTVWRDTKVSCRGTALEDFKKIIMFDERVYYNFKENKQTGTFLYIPTNSRIIFEGADDIGKVLGGSQDISYFNEVTEFSLDVYRHITQRTSGMVLCDYNPSKSFWLESYKADPETAFIHSYFIHNAFCPPNIIKRLKSYEPWEEGSYDITPDGVYYKGSPVTKYNQPPPNIANIEKKTANEYMWLVYGLGLAAEKPNRVYYGWRQINSEEFDNIKATSYFGLDFGSTAPTAVVEVKYGGDGDFYIKPRMYKPLSDINMNIAMVLKNDVPEIKIGESIIVCDSAKQVYINTLKSEGYTALGATKGNDSVNSGISLVKSFSIYYVPDDDFNEEYMVYSWEVDRYNKPTDKVIKANDHYMDAVRYVITFLVDYLGVKLS